MTPFHDFRQASSASLPLYLGVQCLGKVNSSGASSWFWLRDWGVQRFWETECSVCRLCAAGVAGALSWEGGVSSFLCVCACVYVCQRDSERQRDRDRGMGGGGDPISPPGPLPDKMRCTGFLSRWTITWVMWVRVEHPPGR